MSCQDVREGLANLMLYDREACKFTCTSTRGMLAGMAINYITEEYCTYMIFHTTS